MSCIWIANGKEKFYYFLELAWITLKFLSHFTNFFKLWREISLSSEWITLPKNRKFSLIAFQSPFSQLFLFRPPLSKAIRGKLFHSPLNHVATISFQFWWRSIQIPINLSVDLRCLSSPIQKKEHFGKTWFLSLAHTHTQVAFKNKLKWLC